MKKKNANVQVKKKNLRMETQKEANLRIEKAINSNSSISFSGNDFLLLSKKLSTNL